MKSQFALIPLAVLVLLTACSKDKSPIAQTPEEQLEAYHTRSRQVQGDERYIWAKETLLKDPANLDEELGIRALKDMASTAQQIKRHDDAMVTMGMLMRRLEEGSKLWRMAYLVNARSVLKQGRIDEGRELFRAALRDWEDCISPGVLEYYTNTLHEMQLYEQYIIDHYNLSLEFENAYEESEFSLFRALYIQATEARLNTPNDIVLPGMLPNLSFNAMDRILPQLKEKEGHPEYPVIAKAICLIADQKHGEAIVELEALQAIKPPPEELETYNEYRNIPLYIATAMYRRDQDFEKATPYLDDFWEQNRDRPGYVLDAVLDIIGFIRNEDMHYLGGDSYYVSKYLVDKGFTKDSAIREKLTEGEVAHLYSLYQMGLLKHNKVEETKKVCMEVVEEFFPRTKGGTNSLYTLAGIYMREENYDAAEDAFLRILAETRWDHWVSGSERGLKEIWRIRRGPFTRILDRARELAGKPKSTGPTQLELESRLKELYDEIGE